MAFVWLVGPFKAT